MKRYVAIFVFGAAFVLMSTQQMFFYREIFTLSDYPFFITTLNFAVATPFLGVCLFIEQRFFGSKDKGVRSFTLVLCMSAMFAFSNSIAILSQDKLGPRNSCLSVILNQSTIPISMFVSTLTLKKIYTRTQYMCSFGIIVGVGITLIPSLGKLQRTGSTAIWAFVHVVGTVPMAGAMIMAEYLQQPSVFSTTRRYSSLELTFLQNLLGIAFAFLVSPFIELSEGRDMVAWKKDFNEGWLCLRNQEGLQSSARTDCSAAAWSLTSFFPFMVSYALMINIVPRYCGTTPLFLLAALCLPIQNLTLSSAAFMGKYRSDPLVWYNISGLVCIVFFELIYAYEMSKLTVLADHKKQNMNQDVETVHLLKESHKDWGK